MRRANPTRIDLESPGVDRCSGIGGCEPTDKLVFRIEDFECHRAGGCCFQAVVDHCPVWRIRGSRFIGGQWGIRSNAALHLICGGRGEKNYVCCGSGGSKLSEWRDIIEYPERAAVSAHNHIGVVNHQVADRCGWHILPQRLPILTVVERHKHSLFSPSEE